MDTKKYNSIVAKYFVVIGLGIFGFGLGSNILGMITSESLNDYIMGPGFTFALISILGGIMVFVGLTIEKIKNKSV